MIAVCDIGRTSEYIFFASLLPGFFVLDLVVQVVLWDAVNSMQRSSERA